MFRLSPPHATSYRPGASLCLQRRARKRGAILVESLIVISFLILGFMALVFFRAYYTKALVASRLARGSILAYSMTGCGARNHPREWIGSRDLAFLTAAEPQEGEQPAQSGRTPATASGTGGSVLSRLPGLSGDGGGVLNPITTSDLTGRVRVLTSSGAFAADRTVFDNAVRARSFVSCGEPVRDGEFSAALEYIEGIFLGNDDDDDEGSD